MLSIARLILSCFLLLSYSLAQAKGKDGIVMLETGVEYHGMVFFDPGDRVVRIEIPGETDVVKAFSPYQVKYFSYFDPRLETKRVFAPVDLTFHPNASSKEFFEVLLTGSASLLRMEEKDRVNYIHPLSPEIPMTKVVTDYHHYLFIDGVLHEYINFKKQALPLLAKFGKDLNEFIKSNRLKLNDFMSQIRVIDHYNQLADKQYVAIKE